MGSMTGLGPPAAALGAVRMLAPRSNSPADGCFSRTDEPFFKASAPGGEPENASQKQSQEERAKRPGCNDDDYSHVESPSKRTVWNCCDQLTGPLSARREGASMDGA